MVTESPTLSTIHKMKFICLLAMFVLMMTMYIKDFSYMKTQTEATPHKRRKKNLMHLDKKDNDVSCHYVTQGDALTPIDDLYIHPNSMSIFFHDTTCRGGLNSRQACAVEAAARAHPHRQIYVLFSSPVSTQVLKNDCMAELLTFPNIKFARLHILEHCRETYLSKSLLKSLKYHKNAVEKTAEILKFVTLSMWGGVYLDFDVLVVRPLVDLGYNWVVRENGHRMSNKIIALTLNNIKYEPFANFVLFELSQIYDPKNKIYNDVDVVYSRLKKRCPKLRHSVVNSTKCEGISVYPARWFSPINLTFWFKYYEEQEDDINERIYTHTIWPDPFHEELEVEKGSLYDKLASTYCPTIYGLYEEQFGV